MSETWFYFGILLTGYSFAAGLFGKDLAVTVRGIRMYPSCSKYLRSPTVSGSFHFWSNCFSAGLPEPLWGKRTPRLGGREIFSGVAGWGTWATWTQRMTPSESVGSFFFIWGPSNAHHSALNFLPRKCWSLPNTQASKDMCGWGALKYEGLLSMLRLSLSELESSSR